MADNKVAAQPGAASGSAPATEPENKSFLQKYGGQLAQMVFFWLVMKTITGGWSNNNQTTPKATTNAPSEAPSSVPTTNYVPGSTVLRDYTVGIPDDVFYFPNPAVPVQDLPETIVPLWHPGTPMDVSIYINEDEFFVDYQTKPDYHTSGLSYTNWFEPKLFQLEIPATKTIQHNGTVFAHIFVTQHKMPINPNSNGFNPDGVVYYRHELTKFYPQKSQAKQKNLLKGGAEEEEEEHEELVKQEEEQGQTTSGGLGGLLRRAPLVAHWQQNFTLSIIADTKTAIPKTALQTPTVRFVPMDTHLSRVPANDKLGYYRPIVFPNDFWSLQLNAYPVNETISSLPLNIHIEPMSMWKFNIYANLDESMKQQANSPLGGMTSSDLDEVKRMFIETNPVLLGTTIFVSCLHSVFEILAFKNDISFWKKKGNSTGISVRTLIVNIFFQIVIFLYLLDNNQETSYMVLLSNGFGLLLEFWKVFKALKYELVWTPGSLLPKLGQQETESNEEEDETAKYDAIAFKYLKWISYPLLGGYAIYSLYYEEHKSWYSYVLKTLVEFVYMFGFITMLPQLYINYRLKSVAHMPWKTLMYKSLNTFIDDLFAFVIKMPTLHRLACLRDDFVFFVYLYQRYKYKTDHTRANEYGQVGVDDDKESKDKEESKKNK